LDHNNT
jgi:hypothetical protein